MSLKRKKALIQPLRHSLRCATQRHPQTTLLTTACTQSTERLPESRKLELNGYLTKPTTRLARYPLLLEAVVKHTPEDNPDKQTLAQVVTMVREFLGKVNVETGKTENRFNLLQLDQQLVYRPAEQVVRICYNFGYHILRPLWRLGLEITGPFPGARL